MTDENFRLTLEYILAHGNYLNGQGMKGGSYGFKLDSLEKTADVKSVDNKKNLLGYIIEKIE